MVFPNTPSPRHSEFPLAKSAKAIAQWPVWPCNSGRPIPWYKTGPLPDDATSLLLAPRLSCGVPPHRSSQKYSILALWSPTTNHATHQVLLYRRYKPRQPSTTPPRNYYPWPFAHLPVYMPSCLPAFRPINLLICTRSPFSLKRPVNRAEASRAVAVVDPLPLPFIVAVAPRLS